MRPDEISAMGTALRTRVHREVDTTGHFERLMRTHRRGRVYTVAFVTALIVLVVVGGLLLYTSSDAPVATNPPSTVTESAPERGGFERTGVASDDPLHVQAELEALRNSAGPGRIVGFVHLGGTDFTGPPTGPTQPVCEGAGASGIVHAGQAVFVTAEDGTTIVSGILIGAAYDSATGCTMWFGVDVPADLGSYRIQIGGRPPVRVGAEVLDRVGWIIDMWSPVQLMDAYCTGLDSPDPMTCLPIEGLR